MTSRIFSVCLFILILAFVGFVGGIVFFDLLGNIQLETIVKGVFIFTIATIVMLTVISVVFKVEPINKNVMSNFQRSHYNDMDGTHPFSPFYDDSFK